MLRRLIGCCLGLLLVLPVVGSELLGGEGGVWILPGASRVGCGGIGPTSQARAYGICPDPRAGIVLRLPAEMVSPVAVMTIRGTGQNVLLPVDSLNVRIPGALLGSLGEGGVAGADICLVDVELRALFMTLTFDPTNGAAILNVY